MSRMSELTAEKAVIDRLTHDQQAFPHGDPVHGGDVGMTIREWFAGQALAGGLVAQCHNDTHECSYPEHIANKAVEIADAMIAALAKAEGRS